MVLLTVSASETRAADVILVAEDREEDVMLLKAALRKAGIANPVHVAADGEECVAYLAGEGKYGQRDEHPLPVLLLLDLNMPRMNGFEVLQWIRQQPGIRGLPVVVITTSERIFDINRAYELGANSFLVKTFDIHTFADLVEQLGRYWLDINRGPESERPPKAPVLEGEPLGNAQEY